MNRGTRSGWSPAPSLCVMGPSETGYVQGTDCLLTKAQGPEPYRIPKSSARLSLRLFMGIEAKLACCVACLERFATPLMISALRLTCMGQPNGHSSGSEPDRAYCRINVVAHTSILMSRTAWSSSSVISYIIRVLGRWTAQPCGKRSGGLQQEVTRPLGARDLGWRSRKPGFRQ